MCAILPCLQRDGDAIKVAKNILRKDPDFLDVRCALTAFNWAVGNRAAAEDEWQRLQDSQGATFCCVCLEMHHITSTLQ